MEETWRILITDDSGAGGSSASAQSSSSSGASMPQQEKTFYEETSASWKAWKPFLVTGGMLYAMYKSSQIVQQTSNAIWQILSAVMDVFLAPLVPIFTKIIEAVAPLVEVISRLATAFFTPIVDFLTPKMESLVKWIEGIDWTTVENWLAGAGENISSVISSIYDWITKIAIPKWSEWVSEFEKIWSNDELGIVEKLQKSFDVVWEDIGPGVTAVWQGFVDVILKPMWQTFVDNSLLPLFKSLIKDILEVLQSTLKGGMIGTLVGGPLGGVVGGITGFFKGVGDWFNETFGSEEEATATIRPGRALGGYIPETGLYKLHRGEEVISPGEVSNRFNGGVIEMTNIFNIDLQASGDVDTLVREIESKITSNLSTILRRT
jgi:hypothetical protein